jgi:cell wall-associated NlpC family hydrolase
MRALALAVVATLAAGPAAEATTDWPDPLPGAGLGSVTSDVTVSTATLGLVTSTDVASLVDSSWSLAQIDPVTGALLGPDVTTAVTADYAMTADLAQSSLMALDTADLARRSLEQAEAARRAHQGRGDAQGEVGPDGCPTTAPPNTLRAGSANIGIAQLCANSVAQAPTPQAALAIKYQLNHLGVPYSQPNRMQEGYFDCSSLAMRSYQAAGVDVLVGGWAPNTAAIRTSRWAERITQSQVRPGDLVFPFAGHVATALSDGFMVHTNRPGDVSHVKAMYTDLYWAVRVHPEAA